MLVLSTQATAFATTCYLLAAGAGGRCLVLDPGAGAAREVGRLASRHGLEPVAVAATHGHPDHLWDAAAVCAEFGVPFLLHEADQDRLADPAGTLGPGMGEAFAALAGSPWRRPDDVVALTVGAIQAAGLDLTLVHAPGHTPGSTIVVASGSLDPASEVPEPVAGPPGLAPDLLAPNGLPADLPAGSLSARNRTPDGRPASPAVAFTGDVLFAGSIGRVDLPGGDGGTMVRTLRGLRDRVPLDAVVLPGHGPRTTLRRELADNPYLDPRWLASGVL